QPQSLLVALLLRAEPPRPQREPGTVADGVLRDRPGGHDTGRSRGGYRAFPGAGPRPRIAGLGGPRLHVSAARPPARGGRTGYFFGAAAGALSSAIASARVYVISTRSPTLIRARFFGSRALTVSAFPSGPVMVTVCALVSIAVTVAVTVICSPTTPAGVSPGLDVAMPSCFVTPGVAWPGLRSPIATDS